MKQRTRVLRQIRHDQGGHYLIEGSRRLTKIRNTNQDTILLSKRVLKALFITLPSSASEGSRPTYPLPIPHFRFGFCGSIGSTKVAREALGFISRFRPISCSMFTCDNFLPKKSRGNASSRNASVWLTHVPRLLFLR